MKDKQDVQGEQFVLINEIDAYNRNVKNGDMVRVFNERGSFEGNVKITDDVSAGMLSQEIYGEEYRNKFDKIYPELAKKFKISYGKIC